MSLREARSVHCLWGAALLMPFVLPADALASLEGEEVHAVLTDYDHRVWDMGTAVVGDGREFQANVYSGPSEPPRTVVDAFVDVSATTLTLGFEHQGGDLGLNDGNWQEFRLTGLDWPGATQPLEVSLLSYGYVGPPASDWDSFWHDEPDLWQITTTVDSITLNTIGGYCCAPEQTLYATFLIVPEPASLFVMITGIICCRTRGRRQ